MPIFARLDRPRHSLSQNLRHRSACRYEQARTGFGRTTAGQKLVLRTLLTYCFTPTKTIRTVRDWEPRTATSTFTQLLSFEEVLQVNMVLNVHRNHKAY